MALSAGEGNLNNPPQGAPEVAAEQGKAGLKVGGQRARLAGFAAEGLPARPELRDLTVLPRKRGRSAFSPPSRASAASPRRNRWPR